MKHAFAALAVLFLAAGCASQQDSGPAVTVRIAAVDTASDLFYFPGPISLRFAVAVSNPTNEPITLRRLDIRSVGSGAYALRANSTPMNVKIAPNTSATFSISTWGRSRGGYLNSTEPVVLQGTAYFDRPGPGGTFVKIFQQNVLPGL